MEKELVSIIIPVYNAEKYLEKCIVSLLNQTHKNIEIILINDGSKDDSEKICLAFSKKDNRIKYYSKENGGPSSARNFGIKQSNGKFITFVDSDDYIGINSIEKLVLYSNKKTLVSIGHYMVSNEKLYENKYKKSEYGRNEIIDKIIQSEVKGISCGYLFEKNIAEKILFDTNTYYLEDMIFLINYINNSECEIVKYLDCEEKSAYYYVNNPNSTTISSDNVIKKCKMIFYSLEIINRNTKNQFNNEIENRKVTLLEQNMRSIKKREDFKIICEEFNIKKYDGKSFRYSLFSFLFRKKSYCFLKMYFGIRRIAKRIIKGRNN